jgi:hypothetical protein
MAASDQIRQMVNFILQEAHEKANEIRVKVGLSFDFRPLRSAVIWQRSAADRICSRTLRRRCTPPDL